MDDKKRIRLLEERVAYLAKENTAALDALGKIIDLGGYGTPLSEVDSPQPLVEAIADNARALIPFESISLYLVDEEDSSFLPALVWPAKQEQSMAVEVASIIDDGTFSWALKRSRPVTVSSLDRKGKLYLHVLATATRIWGFFIGRMTRSQDYIYDTTALLVTVMLQAGAHALESHALYRHFKASHGILEREVAKRAEELSLANSRLSWEVEVRSQAERAIRDQFQLMSDLLCAMPEPVFYKDTQGRYLGVNPAFEQYFGKRAKELLGSTMKAVLPEDILANEYDAEATVMRTGHTMLREITLKWDEGPERYAIVKKAPFFDTEGRMTGTVGVLSDITEHKRIVEALRQAKLAAEAANQAKSTFLAQMSHEIRTPINAVLGMTQLLRQGALTETQRKQLDIISASSKSLLSIINDILDLSKIEAEKLEIRPQPEDLRQLLEDVVDMTSVLSIQKGIPLVLDAAPDLPAFICSDGVRLKQVLINLVNNALKFTETGRVVLTVRLDAAQTTRPDAQWLSFTVRDTGIGIPPDKLQQIFEPFAQADVSLSRTHTGTGLGLAIARNLTRLLGGEDLWVKSIEGQGSCFGFSLPLRVAEACLPTTAPEKPVSSAALSRLRVLIAEDNEMNQYLLVAMLESFGVTDVEVVENGQEVLRLLLQESKTFDGIFMDVQMPVMDGITALSKLREAGIDTPVVAMTAHALDSERKEGLAAGMLEYIIKPYTIGALTRALYLVAGISSPPAQG